MKVDKILKTNHVLAYITGLISLSLAMVFTLLQLQQVASFWADLAFFAFFVGVILNIKALK